MPRCELTLSANTGISMRWGDNVTLWYDVLHEKKVDGFSTITPQLVREMRKTEAFSAPNLLIFSHLHPDHYSERLLLEAKQRFPNMRVAMPESKAFADYLISAEEKSLSAFGLSIRFRRLPHAGEAQLNCEHYGCIISDGRFSCLLAGDCEVASLALADFVQGEKIDLAVLNFPWLTLKKGRDFVNKIIKPSHILAVHLPFAEDDIYNYRAATSEAAAKFPQGIDVRLLMNPLQAERF